MTTKNTESRLEAFEKMLFSVLEQYRDTSNKMAELKNSGREKSATYRQLFGKKLQLKAILSLYRFYGLIENDEP